MRHFESGVGENLGKTWTCYDCGKSYKADRVETDPELPTYFVCRGEKGEPHRHVYVVEDNPAAVALGSMTSEKKAAAVRENGKKGGRPRTRKYCDACGKLIRMGRKSVPFDFKIDCNERTPCYECSL